MGRSNGVLASAPEGQTPIVALGASAGGLGPLREFLAATPSDANVAYVVIQHLDPTRESQLVSLLATETSMPVSPIGDSQVLEPDNVYVIGPNAAVTLAGGRFRVSKPTAPRGLRTPIDHFFESAAQDLGSRVVGVVLSGTGSDGTRGLLAIREAGGLAIAQDPETADYDGMPRSAIASGATDYVLSIAEIPSVVGRYLASSTRPALRAPTGELAPIFELIHRQTGHDLGRYRPNTLRRRIQRRMDMGGVVDLGAYVELLGDNEEEVERLFADLLIGVTSFFREPEVFEYLADEIIPEIIARKPSDSPVRVWVPGCATGEEAYSLAMLFIEQLRASGKGCPLQVFATDVDEAALDTGRQGLYTAERISELTDERRARFFSQERGAFRTSRDLRDAVVFAPQNLLSDPPFSQIDLVSCRNLLIYLLPEIQRKVVSLFHFALAPGGFLLLGSAETLGRRHVLFDPVAENHRIYRRNDTAASGPLGLPLTVGVSRRRSAVVGEPVAAPHSTLRELTNRALLADFAPAAVVVDREGEVSFTSGDADRFLAVPAGEPTRNVLDLVRRGLRGVVRDALFAVARDGAESSEGMAQVKVGDRYQDVVVRMKPLRDEGPSALYLTTFEQLPPTNKSARPVTDESVVAQLEAELKATRDDLQTSIEELGASNEELRASNEEVLSMNEELQSTNEELETSKEELQSLNEELSTVNAQLQGKLEELARANNDIENLLASADLATLFLDRELRIKRFTSATSKLLNLIESDVGRAITDITSRYSGFDLAESARGVLATLMPAEVEVRHESDTWYTCRILPYRTGDDRIEGVVVTFADISVQKNAEERIQRSNQELEERVSERTAELAEAVAALEAEVHERTLTQNQLQAERDRVDSILATAVDGIITINNRGVIEVCNAAAEAMFGYGRGELVGENVKVLMIDSDRDQHDDHLARYLDTGRAAIIGIGREVIGRRKDGTTFPIDLSVGEMREGASRRFTGILRDISGRHRLEEQLRQTQKMEAIGRLASGIAHDFNNLLMGVSGCANLGLSRLDPDSPARPYFKEIREAAVSGASITRHLLAFSRKREEQLGALELNEAVTHARGLLARLIGEDVSLDVELADEPVWVSWDLGQLEQVLLNLAVNARDAMPSGGDLAIRIRATELDAEAAARCGDLLPGPVAILSISDSGVGIAEEVRAHIFEPFFTTKGPDAGTGLGLSTVYGLVKQANGHIEITSTLGAGTTFNVLLPATAAPPKIVDDEADARALAGSETILVVEDDPLVRLTLRHYLEQHGYATLDANDGAEALKICEAESSAIDLLITDVVLPGSSGAEIAAAIHDRIPGLPVLFASGHPPEMIRARLPLGAEILQKPFTAATLVSRVRATLDQIDGARPASPPAERATVLVVEDNATARNASRELIRDMGYEVLVAASAAEALEQAAAHPGAIDAVVIDLGLPDMSGDALVEALASDGARVRCVIYVSGRSAEDPEIAALRESKAGFLEKPWDPEALEEMLASGLAS